MDKIHAREARIARDLYVILCGIVLIIWALLQDARLYSGVNVGISWDFGGVELVGDPGLFLCEGNYNPSTETYTTYPLPPLFPALVADC